jgi:putative ABC transport system permease protein
MMLSLLWLRGLLLRHRGRLVATCLGIAMAVGLLASIGAFLNASQATMTARSVAGVPVDWQVEVQGGADPAAVLQRVRSQPGVVAALPVGYGGTTGLSATTGGTTQTTGPGTILGLPEGYAGAFPLEMRPLIGSANGTLIAQQTAANLHVGPGDSVVVGLAGSPPATVTIAGVVDLPQADSLFQGVGVPKGSQPSAPPDNVLVLPATSWHQVFDPVAASRPDQVHAQVHVRLDRNLPSAPAAAFDQVTGQARNLEVRLAGAGLVGNNLGAALDGARADATYATVMFLFLGLPGGVLAGLLTAVVAAAGADRRRREQALLRARGATVSTLLRLAALEALVTGLVGSALGLAAAFLIGRIAFGSAGFGGDVRGAVAWSVAAVIVGLAVGVLVVAVPAWRDALRSTIAGARRTQRRVSVPPWVRLGLALVLIGAAVATYIVTSRQGYQLVLAPEGVPSISVDYLAFLGPACLWLGTAVLTWRVAEAALHRGRRVLARVTHPIAGPLAGTVAASMRRQRRLLAPAVVLVALTGAFAASTAVFNATYAQQAEIDARLTNGADVTATLPPGVTGASGSEARLAAISGVHGVEPLAHRFAYVGADLQDFYGVRPSTIVAAGKLQDAYFQGGSAIDLMSRLAAQRDGILVSGETVKDFQLQPGDHLTLRLQDRHSHALVPVTFRYVGIAKEFPTAPRDSFLIANAGYVAAVTGDPSPSTYLIDTGGTPPSNVPAAVQQILGAGAQVTDIGTTRHVVGSSLTAVDLNGLTRLELGFALVFAVGSTGLLLALGLLERRRTFALAAALGARPAQLAAFFWSEAGFIMTGGIVAGAVAGWALSEMLVAVLSGVFDPPPAALAVPWGYLGTAVGLSVIAVAAVVLSGTRGLLRSPTSLLREL